MKKIIRCALLLAVVGCVIYTAGLVSDRKQLEEELVRLHVVAQSDSQQDQQIKLEVRDAVLSTLPKNTSAARFPPSSRPPTKRCAVWAYSRRRW